MARGGIALAAGGNLHRHGAVGLRRRERQEAAVPVEEDRALGAVGQVHFDIRPGLGIADHAVIAHPGGRARSRCSGPARWRCSGPGDLGIAWPSPSPGVPAPLGHDTSVTPSTVPTTGLAGQAAEQLRQERHWGSRRRPEVHPVRLASGSRQLRGQRRATAGWRGAWAHACGPRKGGRGRPPSI